MSKYIWGVAIGPLRVQIDKIYFAALRLLTLKSSSRLVKNGAMVMSSTVQLIFQMVIACTSGNTPITNALLC